MQAMIVGEALSAKPSSTSVSWREPVEVSSFGRASASVEAESENGSSTGRVAQGSRPMSGTRRGSAAGTPTATPPSFGHVETDSKSCHVKNEGSLGVPESVMIVPMEEVATSSELGARKVLRSRGRTRRPDEPAPFLSVDTLPVDKVVVDGKAPVSSTKTGGRPSSGPSGGRRYTGSPKKYQSQVNLNSSMNSSIGGRKTPQQGPGQKQGSRPSSKTSSIAVNYNSFFTHKNSAFLSGPPSLWSVGNKFWPHQNSPSIGRRGPAFPPVMVVEGNSSKPNQLVTQPFKHDVDAQPLTERCVSPSQELKEKTLQAVRDVAKDLSKKNALTSPSRTGRLLKGKLKPLHTFKLQGPSIDKCTGVQAEERPAYTPSQARLLQRKRELLSMLPQDALNQRPMTQESYHHTSIASNLSEDRANDLQSPMRVNDTVGKISGNVPVVQMSAFTSMPPNSLASFGESASDAMSPVPPGAEVTEVLKDNNNEDIKSNYENEELGGNEEHAPAPPEATMSYYMNEGGAASILSDMVDRVKHSAQRVSEEVAEAVEDVFHQSMLVTSEPSFSRSETPANRSMVSDDGLLESASQRSVRFSDHDSFIDSELNVVTDSDRDGDGQDSDVSRKTPTQDVSVRNESLTQPETGHKRDASTDYAQEQTDNCSGGVRDLPEPFLQEVVDHIDANNDQTDIQAVNSQQECRDETKSIDQNNQTAFVKTSEESTKHPEMDVNKVGETSGDVNINRDSMETPNAKQAGGTERNTDVVQAEQQCDDQSLNADQEHTRPESISKIEQYVSVSTKPVLEINTKEASVQEEQQNTIVLPEIQEEHKQNQNIKTCEPEQSGQYSSNEQNVESAISGGSEENESKMVNSEEDVQNDVVPAITGDVNQDAMVTNQVVPDSKKLDLSTKECVDAPGVDETVVSNRDNEEDHAGDKTDGTEVESTVKEQKEEEDEEEADQRESCNRKDGEDSNNKDDEGEGGSSGGGGGGGAGENGHGGNNDGGSNTREDDHDRDGPDESGQGDGNHGNESHGSEESDVRTDSYQNNDPVPQKSSDILKQTYTSNDSFYNWSDKGPPNHAMKKVTKCWYGELEDDVPEIEDSVLFCGICGLDEDACVCPHSSLAPNRTQSGLARPTYNKIGTSEVKSSMCNNKNRLQSAPGIMQGNQMSKPDELDLSSSENKLVLEYKALLGHDAGSGCFSSELTPRKGRRVSQPNAHFLLRGLPVVSSGDVGPQGDRDGRKEDDTAEDSGCESEQMDCDGLQNGHDGDHVKQGSEDVTERADPSTLEVVAEPKTLSRPKSAKNKPASAPAPFPPLCFRINVRPPAGKLFYFAYGVDMNPKRMATYLGSTVERRWGVLFGFKLRFNKRGSDLEAGGFPNIEFDPESSVEGCVYVITPGQLKTLDMFMGSPQFYTHAMFPVWMSNCYQPKQFGVAQYCVAALTYVALDKWTHPDSSKPLSCHYSIEQCLKGSDMLTSDYIQHMKAQLVT